MAPGSHGSSLIKPLIVLLLLFQVAVCWKARDRSLQGNVDLRAYYTAGLTLRSGNAAHLYDYAAEERLQHATFGPQGQTLPFLYPAFAGLPFAIVSLLPYAAAFCLVLMANLVFLYLAARLLLLDYPHPGLSPMALAAIFAALFPMTIALMQGQISCALLLVYAGFHHLLKRRRFFLAGLCLSLALVKFQIALPVALLYLLWKQLRVVSGVLCGGAALAALSLLLTGPRGVKDYIARMHGVGTATLLDPATARRDYGVLTHAEPNLHGMIVTVFHSQAAGVGLTLALSIVCLLVAARCRPSIAVALPCAMLVSYHMHPYDLILSILPITVLYCESGGFSLQFMAWRGRAVMLGSLALLTAPLAPLLLLLGGTCWYATAIAGVFASSCLLARQREGIPGA